MLVAIKKNLEVLPSQGQHLRQQNYERHAARQKGGLYEYQGN